MKENLQNIISSNAIFRSLYESSPLGIIVATSPSCTAIMANSAACQILGCSEDELIGIDLNTITYAADKEKMQILLQQILNDEVKSGKIELRCIAKSGEWVWTKLHISTMQDEANGTRLLLYTLQDIAEKKNAELILFESEKRYNELVKNSPLCIHEINMQGRYISMNPAGLKMLELKNENEIIGKDYIDAVSNQDRHRVNELLQDAFQDKSSEFEFLSSSGRIYKSNFVPLKNEQGKVNRIMGLTQDITVQKENHKKIKEREDLLKIVIETLPVGVYLADKNGKLWLSNKVGREIWLGELNSQPIDDYGNNNAWWLSNGKKIQAEDWAMYRALTKGEVSINETIEIEDFKGNRKILHHSAVPIRNEQNEIIGGVVVAENITEHFLAEKKLRENYLRQKNILDSLFGFVGIYSLKGVLIDANETPIRAAGLTREDVIGKYFPDTYWWSYSNDVQQQLADALDRAAVGEIVRYDVPVRIINGQFITIDVMFGPLRDENGNIKEIIGFGVDITERKRAEEALSKSQQHLSTVVNNAPLVLFSVDIHGTFTLSVGKGLELLGLKPNQIVGTSAFDMYSDVPELMVNLKRAMAGETVRFVSTLGPLFFEAVYSPLLNAEGQIIGATGIGFDITQLKQTEKILAQNEKRLSLIFNSNSDSLMLLKVEEGDKFICESANTAYLKGMREFFPNSSVEVNGRDLKEFLIENGFSQETIEYEIGHYQKAVRSQETVNFEIAFPTHQDTLWLEITIQPIVDSTGRCTSLLRNARDISARKKTEIKLYESEERLRLALQAVNQGIYDLDIESKEVNVTDEYATMLGYNPSVFKESTTFWAERLHPDDREKSLAFLEAYLKGTVPDYRTEFRLKSKSGEWKWILSVGKIVKHDEHGKPLRMLGTHTDITVRKQAEQTIERTNKELKEIIDALDQSSLVSITDRRGTILKVNKRFCEVARYREDELLGQNHRIINSCYHPKDFWNHFWKTISQGEVWRGEIKNRAKDGTEYWVYTVINPIRDESGEISHYLSIRQDITDRKFYEQLLLQSNFRLAQIEQFVDLTTDAIQVSDEKGQLVYINKVTSERLGIPQDECHEYNVSDFNLTFKERAKWTEHIDELKVAKSLTIEGWNTNLTTGISYPVEITARFVAIQNANYRIAISRDITERKKAEEQLQESERILNLAQSVSHTGSWRLNVLTGKLEWSQETFRIFEMPRIESLTYDNFLSFTHPNDREYVDNSWRAAYINNSKYEIEHRILVNNKVKWVREEAMPELNEKSNDVYWIGTVQDITSRKEAEEKIKETENRLSLVLENITDGFFTMNEDWRYTYINKTGAKLVGGFSPEDLIGKVYLEVFPQAKGTIWEKGYRKVMETRKSTLIEEYYEPLDRWFEASVFPLSEKGISVFFRDISVRKRAEREVIKSETRLREAQQMAKIGDYDFDLEKHIVKWSDEVYRIFELEIGAPFSFERFQDFVAKEDSQMVMDSIALSTKFLHSFTIEFDIILNNGVRKHLNAIGQPLGDKSGNPRRIIGTMQDVTIRKQSEIALRESQARLAEAQKLARLGYWQRDIITGTMWWSDEQYEINGLAKSELPEREEDLINLIHPDDRDWVKNKLYKAIETKVELSEIYKIIRPNGEVRVIHGIAHASYDALGQPIKISGVNQDITERVLAEKALREREQTLVNTQRVAKIGSWKLDVKNNILQWSNEVYKIFNVSHGKDLTYEDFLSFVHPEDKEYVEKSWSAALKGARYDIVHRIIVDNNIKWLREQAELTFDELKNLIYGFGTVQDITDQKILQEANLIFNQSQLLTGLGSWRWSIKSNETFWSDNVFNLLELDKKSTVPSFQSYLNAIYKDDRERIKSISEENLAGKKEPFEVEYRVQLKTGEFKWLSAKNNTLFDKHGDPIEMYGIIRDITLEKFNTDELEKARKDAEDASLIKDEFLSVMSHEIRTPLNSVIGLSNLLLKRKPRDDQFEIMKTLKGSADNLLHLVNDILDFNKIRAGKVELEHLPFSLTRFLQHLHSSFSLSALEKGLEFTVQADTRIPDALVGDVTRLNQIFNNLLSNAIKFTKNGHVKFYVDLKNKDDKKCSLVFKIEDTGIGIPTDKLGSIFQPFHQSNSNISREYGGTGLGLSIVKALVDILQGKLSVSSRINNGSIFLVEMDFDLTNNKLESLVSFMPSISPEKISIPIKKSLTVLYVEDVDSNRFLIENLLSDNNIHCISVSSGKAALRFTKLRKFDLILMDIQMPGMDGYQTTRKIQSQPEGKNKQTPVLAFTAENYSDTLLANVIKHGVKDVITKPFDFDTLLKKITLYTKPKGSPADKLFSFSFYEEAFDHNSERLKKIKRSVIADVKRLETKMTGYCKKKDLIKMREEIHRIRPIIKNLACNQLIELLEKYRTQEVYGPETTKLCRETLKVLKSLLQQLSKQDV